VLVVLAHQDEVHELPDVTVLVDELEVGAFRRGHDGHAHVRCQLGQRLDDTVDLDRLCSQVFLVVVIQNSVSTRTPS